MSKKRKSSTTANALPDILRIAYTPPARRLLSRLSKASLVELSLGWLGSTKVNLTRVEDDDEEVDEEDEELDMEVVRGIYEGFGRNKSVRAKEVVERIVEHEWRDGLTLGMVAELDFRCWALPTIPGWRRIWADEKEIDLLDHPSNQKWTSAQLYPLSKPTTTTTTSTSKTTFHPKTFAHTLSTLLRPLVSPHYYITHHPSLPIHMLRIQLHPSSSSSPTTTTLTLPANKQIFWLAFPESTDGYVFHTLPSTTTTTSSSPSSAGTALPEIVRESIATAVSKRGQHYGIRAARMSAKTLKAVAYHRGGEGDGGMLGGWSIFLKGGVGVDDEVFENPPREPLRRQQEEEGEDANETKRRKIAEARFGSGAKEGDGTGLENVVFALGEKFPSLPADQEDDGEEEEFRPKVTVRLEGSHVFAGVRSLVEGGVGFDGVKLPGWLTEEELFVACCSWGVTR
ncbi:CHL4-domain-containing protein [Choiromyces venosus 120613-1]|uniref:CHL4-domain-containing protein n=1 Tax=Choiromyces venosus 120613-1 TaxID=1336337 RepID=A0A3N4K3N3_9PEZI|nr:CHL4-domain-containing protein [Choiromyces venosus 120613-1]